MAAYPRPVTDPQAPHPADRAARTVLDLAGTRPARLGEGRLVCVDGPAGSGKTTLASRVAGLAPGASVVHTDDLLAGWGGLAGLPDTLGRLLEPLSRGEPGRWRRWDWHHDGWAEWHTVEPGGLLVVEGVGAWWPGHADLVAVLVWVVADPDERLRRGLARDGDAMRDHWLRWARDEQRHHAAAGTEQAADVRVDGEGRLLDPR